MSLHYLLSHSEGISIAPLEGRHIIRVSIVGLGARDLEVCKIPNNQRKPSGDVNRFWTAS